MSEGPSRSDWAALRAARRNGEKWGRYGEDVIPAWVADMDYPIAEPIRAALADAVARSDLGYPLAAKKTPLPLLAAERMAAHWKPR